MKKIIFTLALLIFPVTANAQQSYKKDEHGQEFRNLFMEMIGKTKILALIVFIAIPAVALAHGGRTNSEGCHNNSKTGDYHCHGVKKKSDSQPAKIGYDRKAFMPNNKWDDADGDCQNTRHEVLIQESRAPVQLSGNGCRVIAGEWHDPYTGKIFTDPKNLDIDHFVPLKEAYDSGADQWTNEQKRAFANNLQDSRLLIAVSASANRSKGAKDPAQWLPPNSNYHCQYVKTWAAIKANWGLAMDAEEKLAIVSFLKDCK